MDFELELSPQPMLAGGVVYGIPGPCTSSV